jgi:hypothetical protein
VSVNAPDVPVLSSAKFVSIEQDLVSSGRPADVLSVDLQVLEVAAVGPDREGLPSRLGADC